MASRRFHSDPVTDDSGRCRRCSSTGRPAGVEGAPGATGGARAQGVASDAEEPALKINTISVNSKYTPSASTQNQIAAMFANSPCIKR